VTAGDGYRAKALDPLTRANVETDSQMRAEFENLAAAFLRLAEQAERNTKLVIEFELPPENKDHPKIKPKPQIIPKRRLLPTFRDPSGRTLICPKRRIAP
jgi:hypothetical protein